MLVPSSSVNMKNWKDGNAELCGCLLVNTRVKIYVSWAVEKEGQDFIFTESLFLPGFSWSSDNITPSNKKSTSKKEPASVSEINI